MIAIVMGTFLFAGTIKGIVGLGLPSVSLALLTLTIDLTSAMTLLVLPSLITNLWQAAVGGNFKLIVSRIWPFLVMAVATVWVGVSVLAQANMNWLSVLLGILLVVYAVGGLAGFKLAIKAHNASWSRSWLGPLLGAINGILTGLTGSFVVPGVMYLQAVGFAKDQLVQAMGMLFFISTVALGMALQGNDLFFTDLGLLSLFAIVPAFAGMFFGKKIRHKLSELAFRRFFFMLLLLLGLYIIAESTLTMSVN